MSLYMPSARCIVPVLCVSISLILDGDHLDELLHVCQCCLSLPSSLPSASFWEPNAVIASHDLICRASPSPRNDEQSPPSQSASSCSSSTRGCSSLSGSPLDSGIGTGAQVWKAGLEPKDPAFCVEPFVDDGETDCDRFADGGDVPLMWADERSIAESLAIAIVDHLYKCMNEQEYDKAGRGAQAVHTSHRRDGLSRCAGSVRSPQGDGKVPDALRNGQETRAEGGTRRARPQLDVLVKAHVQLGLTAELG